MAELAQADGPRNCICPSCKGKQIKSLGGLPMMRSFAGMPLKADLPGGDLMLCQSCLLKFRFPHLPSAVVADLYNNEKETSYTVSADRNDFKLVTRFARQRLFPGAKVLDFGCSAGDLLQRFDGGYNLYGVEINRKSAAVATQKTGATIYGKLEDIGVDERFDLIAAVDVVEHFEDPLGLINSLLTRINKNGFLVITTGDSDARLWRLFGSKWWYCSFPEHVAFISETWLRSFALAGQSNFRLLEVRRFRYEPLRPFRAILIAVRTTLYGLFGERYLKFVAYIKHLAKKSSPPQTGGVGLTNDHLFIAIGKVN